MDSLNLLHDARPTDADVSPEAFTASRAHLMNAIDGETQGTTAPARRRLSGASRAKRLGFLGGAAALAAGALVAAQLLGPTNTPLGPDPAAAAVLNQAADNAVKFSDPPLKPGQYLKVSSVAEYGSGSVDQDGKETSWIRSVQDEMYIPADRSGMWVWVRHPELPVRPMSTTTDQEFAELVELQKRYEKGSLVAGPGGAFYSPGTPLGHSDDWPDNPRELLKYAQQQGGRESESERAFVWIADRLRQGQLDSANRSLLFRTAALIPGITVADTKVQLDGRTGVALRSAELGHDIIVDPETGLYIGERYYSGGSFTPSNLDSWAAVTTTIVDQAPPHRRGRRVVKRQLPQRRRTHRLLEQVQRLAPDQVAGPLSTRPTARGGRPPKGGRPPSCMPPNYSAGTAARTAARGAGRLSRRASAGGAATVFASTASASGACTRAGVTAAPTPGRTTSTRAPSASAGTTSKARSRSAMRSATSSIPTERRTRSAEISRGVPRSGPCVISVGRQMSDSTPPRDTESPNSSVAVTKRRAAASPPASRSDTTPPKPPDICRAASR